MTQYKFGEYLEEAIQILESVEFSCFGDTEKGICPMCFGENQHRDGCRLGEFLVSVNKTER